MVGSGVGTWLGPGWQGGHLHMPVAPRFAPLGLSLRKPDLGTPVGPQGPCTLSPSEWHPFQVGPPEGALLPAFAARGSQARFPQERWFQRRVRRVRSFS